MFVAALLGRPQTGTQQLSVQGGACAICTLCLCSQSHPPLLPPLSLCRLFCARMIGRLMINLCAPK